AVSTPRGPVPNERRRRRSPHGRRTETTGEWPPATRGSPPARAEDGRGRGPPPRGLARAYEAQTQPNFHRSRIRPGDASQKDASAINLTRKAISSSATPNVRFGSKADIEGLRPDVRFTPKSGHQLSALGCPLSADRIATAQARAGSGIVAVIRPAD